MVDESAAAAVRGIRDVFDQVVAGGFRAEKVEGASDEEIDAMAAAQGVRMVPAALREVLRILGKQGGAWLPGAGFGISMGAQDKEYALWCVEEAEERGIAHGMRDPQGLLAVLDAAASSYVVVDGADLAEADPPMWVLVESGEVTRRHESVTAWFALTGEGVMDTRRMLAERRAHGCRETPGEASYRW
ncbi:hypothetical protein CLM62_10815 [Streptomyces sp. SA15]|nr:hypothetical protein CLM62_10815 [Streptomyces sp. SA15]